MKYRITQYAQALDAALEGKSEKQQRAIIKNFIALLQKHRMMPRLNYIVAACERYVFMRRGMHKVHLGHADGDLAGIQQQILQIFNNKATIETAHEPYLVAGIRILVDDELLIDASAKHQIEKMFQKNEALAV